MVRWGGGIKHVLLDLLVKTAIGFGVGAAGDAIVEFARVPVLTDTGTFGNHNMSNYEYMVYALGTFGFVAGVADLGLRSGKGVFGFTAHATPFFLGMAMGTYFYEHTITNLLGIRGVNPYDIAAHALPPVLPHNFPHPTSSGPGLGAGPHNLPGYA